MSWRQRVLLCCLLALAIFAVIATYHRLSQTADEHFHTVCGQEWWEKGTYTNHRMNPPQGYAVQRVYTDDRSLDETICVQDRDVVLVPRGYHPCVAPHGYDLYYLKNFSSWLDLLILFRTIKTVLKGEGL
jgi:5-deoxy-glucuronate isomerase